MLFVSPSVPKPYLKEGRLRALGLGGKRRLPWLPEVPTFDEAGLTGYEYVCWHGAWFPAGTPQDIVRRMNTELLKAVATPEVRKYLAEADYFPTGTTPEEFVEFLKKDVVRQAEIARIVGIQPQ
jgi:tripartite-type tricarboxylate transporter receptor subunit TctC